MNKRNAKEKKAEARKQKLAAERKLAKEVWEDLFVRVRSLNLTSSHRSSKVRKYFERLEEEKDTLPVQMIIDSPWDPSDIKTLVFTLRSAGYDRLQRLCFWNTGMGDEGCKAVGAAIEFLPTLVKLEIRDSCVTAKGCAVLSEALVAADKRYNYTSEVHAALVKKRSAGSTKKKRGSKKKKRTKKKKTKGIPKIYKTLKGLRILRLNHNQFGNEGLTALLPGLYATRTLEELSLPYCGLTADGCVELGRYLGKCNPSPLTRGLRTLNLEGNELREEGILAVSELGLNELTSLTNLNLSLTQFGYNVDVLTSLARSFAASKALKSIDLDGNLIGTNGCRFLHANLQECKHIQTLKITQLVDPEVFKVFHKFLQSNAPKKKRRKRTTKKKKR